MRTRSQMSMDDLWEMTDAQLWARTLYRAWDVSRCSCSGGLHGHRWRGLLQGCWTDVDTGLIIRCISPVNPSTRDKGRWLLDQLEVAP